MIRQKKIKDKGDFIGMIIKNYKKLKTQKSVKKIDFKL